LTSSPTFEAVGSSRGSCRLSHLPVQDPLHGNGAPGAAPRGRNAATVQPVSDLAQRRAVCLHGQDEGEQVDRALGGLGRLRGVALGAAAELVGEVGRSAQLDAARLGRLGALGIHRRSSCRTGQEQGTDGPNYHEFQIVRRGPNHPLVGHDLARNPT